MTHILIADNNLNYAKSLLNYISTRNSNFRISSICSSGIEILDFLNANETDIILLDLDMPIMNGIDFLSKLKNLKLNKIPKIIVTFQKKEDIKLIAKNPFVIACLPKLDSFDKIYDLITSIIKDNSFDLRKCIKIEMQSLGFNLKYVGSIYLLECIMWIYFHPEAFNNLERNVYSIIADKEKKSVFTIKSNILKCINHMYMETDFNKIREYFSLYYDTRPTPKVVIMAILNHISNNYSFFRFA